MNGHPNKSLTDYKSRFTTKNLSYLIATLVVPLHFLWVPYSVTRRQLSLKEPHLCPRPRVRNKRESPLSYTRSLVTGQLDTARSKVTPNTAGQLPHLGDGYCDAWPPIGQWVIMPASDWSVGHHASF